VLNKAKKAYYDEVGWQVKKLPIYEGKIKGAATLYPARLCDIDNVISIHSKFLLDVLVNMKKIKDDNYKYYLGTTPIMGDVDRKNPRVEFEMEEV
jgi:hypothetical protein